MKVQVESITKEMEIREMIWAACDKEMIEATSPFY